MIKVMIKVMMIKFKRFIFISIIGLLGVSFGASFGLQAQTTSKRSVVSDYVVAVVEGSPITYQDVQIHRKRHPNLSSEAMVLNDLISLQASLASLKTLGRTEDERSSTSASYEQQRLALLRYRERDIDPKIRLTPQDIDDQLTQWRNAQPKEAYATLDLLLVVKPDNPTKEQLKTLEAKAKNLKSMVQSNQPFDQIARQAGSNEMTASVLASRPVQRLPDLFIPLVQAAKQGDVVGPVASDAGFHWIKIIEKQERPTPFSRIETQVRHLLLRPSEKLTSEQAKQQLLALKQRLAAGSTTFEQAAREISHDGSAEQGGLLGWMIDDILVPEFATVMNQLPIGQVSEPVLSRFGWHLIRVEERRTKILTTDEAYEQARKKALERKANVELEKWMQEQQERAFIEKRS